ncbi:MAG TPA: BTAD domain-containing putative transcriptional regulator [Actinomycetota bacterium]|nr:BTAD domain-containing putative transcriptional regulator [Actinomycetota bacterium]
MVGSVEVLVLGPLEVRVGGSPVAVPGARARTFLTRLALEPGRVVPVARLIDAIWEDEPPDGATNALQSLVARVRRALPDCVETDTTGYRLAVEAEAVDAVRFERLAAEGRRRLADGDARGAGAVLREALELWRGPALADAADASFAVAAAARLEELRLAAIEDNVEATLATGNSDGTLVAELEALVAEHPLRERLNGQLVRALAAEGRQADALAAFDRLRTRLANELGIDPSPELQELQVAVLRGEPPKRKPAPSSAGEASLHAPPRTNLRAQITSFVGRESDVQRISTALEGSRLVTLVGPGGSGKTRLATEVGSRLVDGIPGGVWMVELAPVGDPGELVQAFLSVFGAREAGLLTLAAGTTGPEDRLAEAIGERYLVLVVDNCEHLVQAVATLTDSLLARCPSLRVLATSREPLGITGEVLLPIDPLEMPEPDADVGPVGAVDSPAVMLFTDRATAVLPGFVVDESNVRDVVAICRALDGMPLAIELAAARLRSLTVDQVAGRLDDRFRLLGVGGGAALPRHQTLRAVVDWSWELLDEPERVVLRRLATFPGGATLEAAEAVCGGDGVPPDDVLYLLASLVDKSLVNADRDGDTTPTGQVRYTMLDTIRAYADERRREAGEDEMLRRRQAEYLAVLAEKADGSLRGARQLEWLQRLSAERDNVHAAIRWAADAGEAELAMRLVVFSGWFWFMRGARSEAREFSELALAMKGDVAPEYRAGVLVVRATLGVAGGQGFDEALRRGEEAVALIPSVPPERLAQFPTLEMTEMLVSLFRAEEQRALELARARFDGPDRWVSGLAHLVAGQVLTNLGEVGEATESFEASLRDFRSAGDRWGIGNTLVVLADLAAMRGEGEAAAAALEEAQEAFRLLDDREDTAQLLIKSAIQRTQAGDIERAAAELDAAQRIADEIGIEEWKLFVAMARADVARVSGRLDDAQALLDGAIDAFEGYPRSMFPLLGWLLVGRGRVDLVRGDLPAALEWYRRAVRTGLDAPDYPVVARAVEFRADVALASGDAALAAELLGKAVVLRGIADRADMDVLRVSAGAREALGDDEFDLAYRRGAERPRREVLSELDAEAPPVTGDGGSD